MERNELHSAKQVRLNESCKIGCLQFSYKCKPKASKAQEQRRWQQEYALVHWFYPSFDKKLNLKMITTNSQDPNLLAQTYLFVFVPLPKPYFLQYKPIS